MKQSLSCTSRLATCTRISFLTSASFANNWRGHTKKGEHEGSAQNKSTRETRLQNKAGNILMYAGESFNIYPKYHNARLTQFYSLDWSTKTKASPSKDKSSSDSRMSIVQKGRDTLGKPRSSLLKDENRYKFDKNSKTYKGSFCQVQEGIIRESSTHETTISNVGYKTPMKPSKISLNLAKTEKISSREPYVTAITLDMMTEETKRSKEEKSNSSINTSQLLSNKMFNELNSLTKSNPFNASKKFDPKEKPKTSLEIYSKTIKQNRSKY